MWVVVGVVALVVLVATYLTWTAARVDRLHARTAAAFAALDAQSLRRAVAAAGLGDQTRATPRPAPDASPLSPSEPAVPDAGPVSPAAPAWPDGPVDLPGLADLRAAAKAVLAARADDRELAENDLTRAVRSVAANAAAFGAQDDRLAPVMEANRRLALARQLHNDLVRDALALRRRPLVRMLRLARRHPRPRFFDIDEPTMRA